MFNSLEIKPSCFLEGEVCPPGDKSLSHRVVILGSIAQGVTTLSHFLMGEDCLHTLKACQQLGVDIAYERSSNQVEIQGRGLSGLQAPRASLDAGNAGTALRLLAGLLAGQSFSTILLGDSSLCQRPMQRIIAPLKQMGADIEGDVHPGKNCLERYPPLKIKGKPLTGIDYTLPVPSAQVKSCILLAGLYAKGKSTVRETSVTRDHTERLLKGFGYPLEQTEDPFTKEKIISLEGGGTLKGQNIAIPGDISSAAFFLVGAAMKPGSHILLKKVGINPTRNGILHLLQSMGARLELSNECNLAGEPVADIEVWGTELKGVEVAHEMIANAIDEFPIFFIAAAVAKGKTILRGAQELRVKESDRIATMVVGLRALGVTVEELPDGLIIEGDPRPLKGGHIDAAGDHRVAMAFAMAGLISEASIFIKNCEAIATSFPTFPILAKQLGLRIHTL